MPQFEVDRHIVPPQAADPLPLLILGYSSFRQHSLQTWPKNSEKLFQTKSWFPDFSIKRVNKSKLWKRTSRTKDTSEKNFGGQLPAQIEPRNQLILTKPPKKPKPKSKKRIFLRCEKKEDGRRHLVQTVFLQRKGGEWSVDWAAGETWRCSADHCNVRENALSAVDRWLDFYSRPAHYKLN